MLDCHCKICFIYWTSDVMRRGVSRDEPVESRLEQRRIRNVAEMFTDVIVN